MLEKRLEKLWDQLRGKKPRVPHFLSEITLSGIRGIDGLRVVFDYPVSVIAGGNASGKSTVLFAAACAYRVPGAGPKAYVPSTLFPDYRPKQGGRLDERPEVNIEYEYATPDGRRSMRWRRRKGWNRSFFGRKGGKQPERVIYLRTLSNLSNPSEVRSVLRMSHLPTIPEERPLTAAQIDFARQMLPFDYREVIELRSGDKNLLFAAHKDGAAYSELQMAAGERAILRLAQEIAQLNDALILIDEIEAGLHPWVQQLLMMQLQQLALRNDLQIIVTSHSPVVLDSVPNSGRIFLERGEDNNVKVRPPYQDVIQNALYGRSSKVINLLCEDETAEGILHGILDYLSPKLEIRREAVRIGCDTGAEEFPAHAAAFKKFGLTENFVFILDGDQQEGDIKEKIKEKAGSDAIWVLFLPGKEAPEAWIWNLLKQDPSAWARRLSTDPGNLTTIIRQLSEIYDSASDAPSQVAKTKMNNLAEALHTHTPDLCRTVARVESAKEDSEIIPLVNSLQDVLEQWRAT